MAIAEETKLNADEGSSGAADMRPIPTPLKLQVRRLQYTVAPLIVFLAAAVTAGFLWNRHIGPTGTMGEVAAANVLITAPAHGQLVTLPREVSDRNLEKFDRVRAGDVVARMDDTPFINAARTHENDLDKLRRQLSAKQQQLAALIGGAGAGAGAPTTQKSSPGNVEALRGDIAVLEDQVRFKEGMLQDLNQKISACTIRSPVNGTITTIFAQPGTTVRQGREIMTITEDQGQYIVSYVRQTGGVKPKKDMLVDIRVDGGPGGERRISRSRVQEVGNQIEPVPPQQLANPRMPEFGVPVRIAMPSDVKLRPGELVGVVFRPELNATIAGAAGASATD
jgi:multidrug resistance efflux pump